MSYQCKFCKHSGVEKVFGTRAKLARHKAKHHPDAPVTPEHPKPKPPPLEQQPVEKPAEPSRGKTVKLNLSEEIMHAAERAHRGPLSPSHREKLERITDILNDLAGFEIEAPVATVQINSPWAALALCCVLVVVLVWTPEQGETRAAQNVSPAPQESSPANFASAPTQRGPIPEGAVELNENVALNKLTFIGRPELFVAGERYFEHQGLIFSDKRGLLNP